MKYISKETLKRPSVILAGLTATAAGLFGLARCNNEMPIQEPVSPARIDVSTIVPTADASALVFSPIPSFEPIQPVQTEEAIAATPAAVVSPEPSVQGATPVPAPEFNYLPSAENDKTTMGLMRPEAGLLLRIDTPQDFATNAQQFIDTIKKLQEEGKTKEAEQLRASYRLFDILTQPLTFENRQNPETTTDLGMGFGTDAIAGVRQQNINFNSRWITAESYAQTQSDALAVHHIVFYRDPRTNNADLMTVVPGPENTQYLTSHIIFANFDSYVEVAYAQSLSLLRQQNPELYNRMTVEQRGTYANIVVKGLIERFTRDADGNRQLKYQDAEGNIITIGGDFLSGVQTSTRAVIGQRGAETISTEVDTMCSVIELQDAAGTDNPDQQTEQQEHSRSGMWASSLTYDPTRAPLTNDMGPQAAAQAVLEGTASLIVDITSTRNATDSDTNPEKGNVFVSGYEYTGAPREELYIDADGEVYVLVKECAPAIQPTPVVVEETQAPPPQQPPDSPPPENPPEEPTPTPEYNKGPISNQTNPDGETTPDAVGGTPGTDATDEPIDEVGSGR